ncbi:HlyD family efflux transporter periplasmic adaptor subunit [Clostridium tertium]|uniref:Efflux system component YknX n=1 Tax=Clostridium tertium TaxID=1559 RepID=A0A6N3AC57_9CLOT
MKNKKLIIGGVIFAIAIVLTVAAGLYVKNQSKAKVSTVTEDKYFTVEENSGLKFKGTSIISKEQKIMLDVTSGKLNEVFVEDGQAVEKDTILFNYYNETMQEQVDDLNRQISSLNSKIDSEKERVKKLQALNQSNIENNKDGGASTATIGNQQIQQVDNSAVEELNYSLNDLISKRDSLREKVIKPVKAEINGKVYINNEDATKEYMRVISEDYLIESDATEFDVDKIKVDDKVNIKVISNNKTVTGKITKIDEIPTTSLDQKSVSYKFYVKPDEGIKIGFSVELSVNQEGLPVPKSSVIEEDGKQYVIISDGESQNKIEVTGTLKDDNYIISSSNLKVGDKILLNPLEDGKEAV